MGERRANAQAQQRHAASHARGWTAALSGVTMIATMDDTDMTACCAALAPCQHRRGGAQVTADAAKYHTPRRGPMS